MENMVIYHQGGDNITNIMWIIGACMWDKQIVFKDFVDKFLNCGLLLRHHTLYTVLILYFLMDLCKKMVAAVAFAAIIYNKTYYSA